MVFTGPGSLKIFVISARLKTKVRPISLINPILTHQGWIWLCLVWATISLKLQYMAEKFEKNQVLPRGSSEHFNKFTQSCKTYHFIVKSIFKNFSGWTRSHDAYARFSPIYNIVFSLYRVCLHPLLPPPPTPNKVKFFVGPRMSGLLYIFFYA